MNSSAETPTSHEALNYQQESSTGGNDTVSHSLLSAAKDARYIEQCYKLIVDAMQSIQQPFSSRSEAEIKRSSMLLSTILYILIVIFPSNRTLGMEVCGLKFKTNQGHVRKLIAPVLGWYALERVVEKVRSIHPIENQELLRGTTRMEMHRRLRRQMMERAQIHTEASNDVQSNPSQTARTESLHYLLQKLVVVVQSIIRSLRLSLDQSEGPHSLENQQEADDSRLSLVTWMLRLHMAHYCVAGTYPTIIHRLLNLNHALDGSTEISYRPETNRIVALLVGVQAAASMSRFVINVSADSVAQFFESKRFKSSMQAPRSLEQSVFKKSTLRFDPKSHCKSICGICRLERKHAAASIHCGHVFCWNCLYQWTSTVQEACPLCRRPCRTQDFLFLHNYQV